jgi:hypothetical protein
MAVVLLLIYLVAYFVGNLGAAGVNALAKRKVISRRMTGVVLVLAASGFYLYITAQAFAKIDTARLSSYDRGRLAGEVFANVLLPLAVVLICVGVGAWRERSKSVVAVGRPQRHRVDPS